LFAKICFFKKEKYIYTIYKYKQIYNIYTLPFVEAVALNIHWRLFFEFGHLEK